MKIQIIFTKCSQNSSPDKKKHTTPAKFSFFTQKTIILVENVVFCQRTQFFNQKTQFLAKKNSVHRSFWALKNSWNAVKKNPCFKGHKAVLLKAILAKTSNFWPIGPIELKFWHLILKIIHFNISLRQSHGSSFIPLWWL